MKKFALGSIALLTLVFGTYSIPASVNTTIAATTTPTKTSSTGKTGKTASAASIPPPTCPPSDPNGCGIFE